MRWRLDCLLNCFLGTDQRRHQSSASLAFVREFTRGPVNSTHKGPATRKMSPFDDVIIISYTRQWPYCEVCVRAVISKCVDIVPGSYSQHNTKPGYTTLLIRSIDRLYHSIWFGFAVRHGALFFVLFIHAYRTCLFRHVLWLKFHGSIYVWDAIIVSTCQTCLTLVVSLMDV